MPLINGQKYACSSCIRGHRVSNCNHEERELKLIAPKGRPVKQCDHCRGARKSKSNHTKCDCGTRRDKKEHSPANAESSCNCADGDDCHCGKKSESLESRMARSLARPAMPVKSKSVVVEAKMTQFANGHHKPVHRNNISAHVSGAPYCKPRRAPRPQSAHVEPIDTSMDDYGLMLSRSADDLTFSRLSQHMPHMSMTSDAALTSAGADASSADDYFDFDKHFFRSGGARFDQPGGGSNYASTRGSPTPQQAFGTVSSMPPATNAVASPNFDAGDDMYPMQDYFAASTDGASLGLATASLQQPGLAHSDGSAPLSGSPVSMTDEAWAAAAAELSAPSLHSQQSSDVWDSGMTGSAADLKSWMMLPNPSAATYPGAGAQLGLFDSATAASVLGVPALAAAAAQQQAQQPVPSLHFKTAARLMTPPAAVTDSPPHAYLLLRRAGGGGGAGTSGLASGNTSACPSNLDEDEPWGDARVAGLDAPVVPPLAAGGGDSSLWNTYSWLMDDESLGRR